MTSNYGRTKWSDSAKAIYPPKIIILLWLNCVFDSRISAFLCIVIVLRQGKQHSMNLHGPRILYGTDILVWMVFCARLAQINIIFSRSFAQIPSHPNVDHHFGDNYFQFVVCLGLLDTKVPIVLNVQNVCVCVRACMCVCVCVNT